MKPSMHDEVEDDLAAEEENKLINEVFTLAAPTYTSIRLTLYEQEYKTWYDPLRIPTAQSIKCSYRLQEEERALSLRRSSRARPRVA